MSGCCQKHLSLGITDAQRFRFVSLMSLAADDAAMPKDPEFRSARSCTSNGEPASCSETLNATQRSSHMHLCRDGVGVRLRRTVHKPRGPAHRHLCLMDDSCGR